MLHNYVNSFNEINKNHKFRTDIRDPKAIQFHKNINIWLSKPNGSFFELAQGVATSKYTFNISPQTTITDKINDPIYLIQQYYIPTDKTRRNEIKKCLQYNCSNDAIDKIILLNEKTYTSEELGTDSPKIKQVVINSRLTYKKVFEYAAELQNCFIILANSDIFFDLSIKRLRNSGMTNEKKMYTLLRYEFDGKTELKKCRLFGPRPDSQDSWIWHSKWKLPNNIRNIFDINLGKPGCDNKILYLLSIVGFSCYNEPLWIHSYHFHPSQIRGYTPKSPDTISLPYIGLFPTGKGFLSSNTNSTFDIIRENIELCEYITNKFTIENKPFIIPRIAGIENEVAMFGALLIQQGSSEEGAMKTIKNALPVMKTNAGISLTNIEDICLYSKNYLDAFHKCERYFWWAPWGEVVKWIPRSFDFIITNFTGPKFDAITLDIFHHIYREPWTLALKGKRILIISSFIESIKEKIPIRDKIYGIDLFPDCEFVFIKPPQTHGNNDSRRFPEELADFVENVRNIKDSFDIALCSCGGYGNAICSAIYDMNKSAIYVGGVLQMYFGIYGERWMRERPDIMRMFLNKYWSRPKESERPKNFKNVEKSCYW